MRGTHIHVDELAIAVLVHEIIHACAAVRSRNAAQRRGQTTGVMSEYETDRAYRKSIKKERKQTSRGDDMCREEITVEISALFSTRDDLKYIG
jgi:hypothetical protein